MFKRGILLFPFLGPAGEEERWEQKSSLPQGSRFCPLPIKKIAPPVVGAQ